MLRWGGGLSADRLTEAGGVTHERPAAASSSLLDVQMIKASELNPAIRVPLAGFLAWLVPGLGHLFLGERVRGVTILITITLIFWAGIAIGGVRETVDPKARVTWFLGQVCTGSHALAAYGWGQAYRDLPDEDYIYRAHWLSSETGVVYTGVAGLLNLLVILDALVRADMVAGKAGRRVSTTRTREGEG